MSKTSTKTYKRETAWIMLGFIAYLAFVGQIEELKILAWPTFLFAGAAFGMDWAKKQTDLVGGSNFGGRL